MTILRSFALTLLLSLSLLTVYPPSQADASYWVWKRYKLRFWLPNGMRVTQNNRFQFIAKGRGLILKIKPWKSRYSTARSAALYGLRTYSIIRGKRVKTSRWIRGKRGFKRYLILGKGWIGRSRVYFAVVGFSSKYSVNNFYLRMWWKAYRHPWVKKRILRIVRRFRTTMAWGQRLHGSNGFVPPRRGFIPPPRRTFGKRWNWPRYRLSFWLPAEMRVTRNNAFSFIAKSSRLVMKIKPWKSRRATARTAALYGYRTYYLIGGKRIYSRRYIRSKGGFSRYLILGRGWIRGEKVYFAVIGLVSHRSINNFYVRLWWRARDHFWVNPRIVQITRRFRAY